MKLTGKLAAAAAAAAMISQPCLAAERASNGSAERAASSIDFDLKRQSAATLAARATAASVTLSASQETASETQDEPKRRGPGTTTWLIIGGVAVLALVAVVALGSGVPANAQWDED